MVTSFTCDGKTVLVVTSNVAYATVQLSQAKGESKLHFIGGGEQAVDQTIDEVRELLVKELGSKHLYKPGPARMVPLRL